MLDLPSSTVGEAPNLCQAFVELDEVIAMDVDQDLMGNDLDVMEIELDLIQVD